jgi:hypothetical protein
MSRNSNMSARAAQIGGLSWPLIMGTLAMLYCLLVGRSALLMDHDSYLHLHIGQWIVDHYAIPLTDSFSYTKLGEPWTAHEWLAAVIYALAYKSCGWFGLVFLTALAFACTLASLTRYLLKYLEPVYVILLVILVAAVLRSHLLARPHVLVWPLLVVWAVYLSQAAEKGQAPSRWLTVVMLLWVNLHGSFILGLALIVPFALEALMLASRPDRIALAKRWTAFSVIALLSAMVNPFGWKIFLLATQLTNLKIITTISEWRPTEVSSFYSFELWLLLLFGFSLTGRLKVSWARIMLFLGLLFMAFSHVRHTFILVILSTVFLASALPRSWYGRKENGNDLMVVDRFFNSFIPAARLPAIFCSAVIIATTALIMNRAEHYAPDPSITPENALSIAAAAGAHGRVLNDYGFGGYLVFRNIPVFIDGRADLYGNDFIAAYENATAATKLDDLTNVLNKYSINWTLLDPAEPANERLDALPGWRRVYTDGVAVVYIREAP